MKCTSTFLPAAILIGLAAPLFGAVISQGAAVSLLLGTNTAGVEAVTALVDGTTQKYFSYYHPTDAPFGLLPQVQLTPTVGASVVTGVTLFAGNDVPGRDPASFSLYGSNDGGTNYFLIVLNQPISLDASSLNYGGGGSEGRNNMAAGAPEVTVTTAGLYSTSVNFANTTAYATYKFEVNTLRNNGDGFQLAELQLIGTAVPEPTTAFLSLLGGAAWLGRRRR